MNLNVTRSRRWRLHETTPPRRRRRGRTTVYATASFNAGVGRARRAARRVPEQSTTSCADAVPARRARVLLDVLSARRRGRGRRRGRARGRRYKKGGLAPRAGAAGVAAARPALRGPGSGAERLPRARRSIKGRDGRVLRGALRAVRRCGAEAAAAGVMCLCCSLRSGPRRRRRACRKKS